MHNFKKFSPGGHAASGTRDILSPIIKSQPDEISVTIESFLTALQAQETLVEKFEPPLWYGLLDFVTVYAKDNVRFTFKNGTEIKA